MNSKLLKEVLFVSLIFALILITVSCIDEGLNSANEIMLENNALALTELENRGDYINSYDFPASQTAEEVNNNFEDYIIIDVRSTEDFSEGRIPNSINIQNTDLYNYVIKLNTNNKKILLVSRSGQAASYFVTLLRYAGIKNIYSLKFGIATWNNNFAHYWKDYLRDYISNSQRDDFNHIAEYLKPKTSTLPNNFIKDNELSIGANLNNKIKELIDIGFDEVSYGNVKSVNTVDIEYLVSNNFTESEEYFIVCFANAALYFRPNTSRGCLLQCPSHPKGTHLYNAFPPYNDFRSTAHLQSLPENKTIILYSFTGERSAAAVAYLSLLGYSAKSIIFGGQNIFNSRFVTTNFYSSEFLASFGVQEESFMNYSYDK